MNQLQSSSDPEFNPTLSILSSEIKKLLSSAYFPHDTKILVKKLEEGLKEKNSSKISELSLELWRNFETSYLISLLESIDERYRGSAREMMTTMCEEMNASNELEKSIVETCVGSFLRYLDNSRRLNNELNCQNITPNRNNYISILSKQVDRAHRQYLSSLQILLQMKQPKLNLNIKAETAFIADKQQINSVNSEKHEINESK